MNATTPTTIDPTELSVLLESGTPPRVLDVRTPGEFDTVHIGGAYNVPLDLVCEHRDEITEHLDPGVVLVCRSGQRAAQAQDTLRDAGLPNLRILIGGISAWEGEGFTVIQGAERWDLERQVRFVAGVLVLVSILASVAVPQLKWLAAIGGAGLAAAALSNTCAMGMLLSRLPYNRGASCDAQSIVAQLAESSTTRAKAS
jgi:rhodanese-related sulfurtransferase